MWERFLGFLKPKIRFKGWEGDVQTLPPPDSVRLPLSRSGQMPFNPVVDIGDKVKTGQFIAMLPNHTGVHATVTGRVTSIGPGSSWDGREILTLSIQRETEDVPETPIMPEALKKISRDQLTQTMADLGFASPWKPEFLKDKLSEEERTPVHTVIIRAVDREPPLSVQRRFLIEFSRDLAESVEGLRIMAGDARIVVAVPESMAGQAKSFLKDVDKKKVVGVITQTDIFKALISLTGVGKKGIQFAFKVEDKPGSIKDVTDIIRKHGGRIVSILSSYEHVPEGYRKVYIRDYGIERKELKQLKNELKEKANLLYLVDHRENKREVY